ncbi:NAD(P)H-binding protein, partial [Streptomyces sp. NPDC001856]|uniref:NAD(P)H-binding protein n=1 Tax=Streptomyces sp. NPDC001856 TaxID=3154399 RepID=UPI00332D551F
MKLLILGATGPTGRHVVDLAVAGGDAVTVLARRPQALDDVADRVRVVAGDATSYADDLTARIGAPVELAGVAVRRPSRVREGIDP